MVEESLGALTRGHLSAGALKAALAAVLPEGQRPLFPPAASAPTAHVLPKGQRPHEAQDGEDCVIDKGQRSKEMESEGDRGRVDG